MSEPATPPQPAPLRHGHGPARGRAATVGLTVAAVGVVFGDIGTSPLYAMHAVFAEEAGLRPDRGAVYGVISLVFWAVTIIVSVKYLALVMRADNEGEGGIMALIALVQSAWRGRRMGAAALVALGIFGAALFYGDGMITPAISVLSAVEGLKVVSPSLDDLVIPITVTIVTVLFAIQRFGTGAVGRLFGPVMVVWFLVLAVAGVGSIADHPRILQALSPSYGVAFFLDHGVTGFLALGAVVLAVTGAEALYADMGHFGRSPIRRAWFLLVFPALTLNYLGQGALVLGTPAATTNPFFLLFPEWSRIPMVVLATAATVIACQAVISGAFSVSRQAVSLGFLPRLTIHQTSGREFGQVYVPAVNWGLFVAVVALIVGFGSSAALASAYGIAVTGTLAIDTVLFFVVARLLFRTPLRVAVAGATAFLVVDLAFFSANLPKVVHGGWFPLAVGAAVFTVLMTWQRGREIVTRNRTKQEGSLREFIREVNEMDPPLHRVPGTAVFLNPSIETTPLALRANVEHNHVLHEDVVVISVETMRVPHVPASDRVVVDNLGYQEDNVTHVTARYGFKDEQSVPDALRLAAATGLESEIDVDEVTYFLSRITIVSTDAPGMMRWRKRLFMTLSRNAADPVRYFGLPPERTVIIGSQVAL